MSKNIRTEPGFKEDTWQESKISDLCELIVDCVNRTAPKTSYPTPFKMIRTTNVRDGKIDTDQVNYVTEETYKTWIRRGKPTVGDIILTREAPVGEVGIVRTEENIFLGQRTMMYRADGELIDPQFLYYSFLTSYLKEQMVSAGMGSVVEHIRVPDAKEFLIKHPSLPEQQAIASTLSSLDDKIDLLHRQNKTLEAIAETLFRQWFIEEAQDNWEEGTLVDVSDNIRDAVKPADIHESSMYVGLEHIDRRDITLKQCGSGEDVSSNKYAFKGQDVLFGKLRPYFHKVCFTPFSGICSTDILVIRPKQEKLFPFCLFAFFQDDVVEFANLGSGGTRMPRTSWQNLKSYPINVPDMESLIRFNKIVSPSIERMTYNLKQARTLEKLRDTLLPKLMSGEVRVEL